MSEFYHDHDSLEAFVRALAKATEYKGRPLGFADYLDNYWKAEAQDWVKELDAPKKAAQVQTSGPQCKRCGAREKQ